MAFFIASVVREECYKFEVSSSVRLANMADRKSRSVTFKVAFQVNVGVLKIGIERVTSEEITVFQNIGNLYDEFFVKLKSKNAAEALIEEGFDVEELHLCCHPPQGYYTNVSIMGLRSYVEDDEVIEALKPYGEIKSEIFRPKYKSCLLYTSPSPRDA